MKKFLCGMLCAALLIGYLPAQAATGDQQTIEQVIGALEIMTGDENGDLHLSDYVSRAEFAKMLVTASIYKDTIAPTGNSSPFRDVPYTHWAANYIKTAVSEGWLTGYLNGTYRPFNNVTCAEAATAILKLLGYTATDFSGSYPTGQIALARSFKLLEGVSCGQSTALTRRECMRMFYNLLSIASKDSAQKYIVKLGYSVDVNGDPDYADLLDSTLDGPVVITSSWQSALGFTPVMVYRNDTVATTADLQKYDVLYYSSARKTVWAYARRVTGTYEKAQPNKQTPTSVTVAGTSYEVSGASATVALGSNGGMALGAVITLILGRNGEVVAAYPADTLAAELVGVVTAVSTSQSYTEANGATYTSATVTLTAADGQSYTVQASRSSYSVGQLIRVAFDTTGTTITGLSKVTSLSGTVRAAANKIGSNRIAADANVLDVTGVGGAKVYLSRLDGLSLSSADIVYYEKNAAGEIETLLLNDVTGDQYSYGIMLSGSDTSQNMTVSGSYKFLINGVQGSTNTSGTAFGVTSGPAKFEMSGSQMKKATALQAVSGVTAVTSAQIKNASKAYTIGDNAAVYVYDSTAHSYSQVDRSRINTDTYSVSAYYDRDDSEGGRIRVIILQEKN